MAKKKNKKKVSKSVAVKDQQLGKKKETAREKMIGQSIGYRYDVNLLPDYSKMTPFLKKYVEAMGWDDLNWLEDVHMGYEEGRPAVFCSCLLYTSPSPRDRQKSRMPSSA